MKPFSTRNLIAASCTLAAAMPLTSAMAQVVPNASDTIEVTEDGATWIQVVAGNGVDIPAGADGVVINNALGGVITGDPNAIITAASTTINNGGNITGAFNGVNFVNGLGSGVLNNVQTGLISSDSRAVNIGGPVVLTNFGRILGTGDQRNGTVYSNISANNFSITNGLTGLIDAGAGNLGAGFSAELSPLGTFFTLVNDGNLIGRGNAGAGSALAGDGIRLERTRVDGALDGTTTGLFTGTITNTGTIISEGANGTVGGFRAVNGVSFQGTLDNSGTISGVQNGVYFGNPIPAGGGDHTGGVVNNSGLISSDSRAFNLDGLGLVVNNSGQILGTGDQRNGTFYADGTADDYTVNNLLGGVIDAGAGNQGSGFGAEIGSAADGANTFELNNAGTIQGRGNAAAGAPLAGDGVRIGNVGNIGTAEVNLNNSGTISSEGANGTVAGVRFVNGISFDGVLNNAGVIEGVQNGLYFGNAVDGQGADHSNGVVNNTGTIRSDSRALNIDGTGLTVVNAGDILGTGNQRNGTAYADGTADDFTVNNLAGGTIDAGEGNTGSGFGAEIGGAADGANTFTLNNAGTIQGRGNGPAGENSAGDGVRIGNVGNIGTTDATIVNSGTISSEGANGTVAGVRVVNGISFQGTLTNAQGGVIEGVQNGLYFGNAVDGQGADHTGGVVNNAGTIRSDSRALNIDGTGLVVNNAGQIVGTGNQRNGTAYADGTADDFTVNNLPTGTIDAGAGNTGSGLGVEIGGAADGANTFIVNNDGTIQGRGNAGAATSAAGDGIRVGNVGNIGTAEVNLNNTGLISSEGANGTVAGIRFVNGVSFAGELNNSGIIEGVQNGLYFGNAVNGQGADHSNGVVNNTGTIRSDSRAFNLDGNGLTVNNNGAILATGRQRNGTFYVDGTADNFTLNNQFAGRIDARGGAGSGVSIQVGNTASDIQNGTINNAGLIAGSGELGVDAGIRLFTPAPGATFVGDINNQVGGIITADNAPAILVEQGVNFQGNLINNGTIDGAVSFALPTLAPVQEGFAAALSDAPDVILGSTSQLVLDIAGTLDGEFETFDVPTHDLVFGGVLELNFLSEFLPQVGDSFDLFDFANASGSFASIQAGDIVFDTNQLVTNGVLTVSAVPEPSSLALLALGATMLYRRRRNG